MPVIPLSGGVELVDITTLNKLANSAQVREKCLKILQYSLRLVGYVLSRNAGGKASVLLFAAHVVSWAKIVSTARRFFKLLRWIKVRSQLAHTRYLATCYVLFASVL